MNEWSVSEEPCDAFEEVSKHSWGEKWKMKREGRKRKLMNCTFVCSGLKEYLYDEYVASDNALTLALSCENYLGQNGSRVVIHRSRPERTTHSSCCLVWSRNSQELLLSQSSGVRHAGDISTLRQLSNSLTFPLKVNSVVDRISI